MFAAPILYEKQCRVKGGSKLNSGPEVVENFVVEAVGVEALNYFALPHPWAKHCVGYGKILNLIQSKVRQ